MDVYTIIKTLRKMNPSVGGSVLRSELGATEFLVCSSTPVSGI